jgi:hypothetical protein
MIELVEKSLWCCSCESFDFEGEPNFAYGVTPEEAIDNFSRYVMDLKSLIKVTRATSLARFKREIINLEDIINSPEISTDSRFLAIEGLWDLEIEVKGEIIRYEKILNINVGDFNTPILEHVHELQQLITEIKEIKTTLKALFIVEGD